MVEGIVVKQGQSQQEENDGVDGSVAPDAETSIY